jgi:ATP-dependent DNA ligase
LQYLREISKEKKYSHIEIVETTQVNSLEQINKLYEQYFKERYEGAMVRIDAEYKSSFGEPL